MVIHANIVRIRNERKIQDIKKHLLITPADVPAFHPDLQVIGVFNPGATVVDGRLVLIVRVAVKVVEQRDGYFAELKFVDGKLETQWLPRDLFDCDDSRVMRRLSDGKVTLSSVSYLQLIWIENYCEPPENWHLQLGEIILPEGLYETYGIEDARCTWVDGRCYITYTSVSSHGASTSLMTTTDFCKFQRHGVIFVCENKDVVLFPARFDGKLFALHRPVSATKFCQPEIWAASSVDGFAWGDHDVFLSGSHDFEGDRIGAGAPPVWFQDCYLAFYHASEKAQRPSLVGRYVGGLITMNIVDGKLQLLKKSIQPLLVPSEKWELEGFVPDVVFPTAMIHAHATDENVWHVFYGAADTCIGVATISTEVLMRAVS